MDLACVVEARVVGVAEPLAAWIETVPFIPKLNDIVEQEIWHLNVWFM